MSKDQKQFLKVKRDEAAPQSICERAWVRLKGRREYEQEQKNCSASSAARRLRHDRMGCRTMLVVDNAGWHTAKRLVVPDNIIIHRLPPCTPELRPIETLWPLVRESVANRIFRDIGHLKNVIRRRCVYLTDHPDIVQERIGFGSYLTL